MLHRNFFMIHHNDVPSFNADASWPVQEERWSPYCCWWFLAFRNYSDFTVCVLYTRKDKKNVENTVVTIVQADVLMYT